MTAGQTRRWRLAGFAGLVGIVLAVIEFAGGEVLSGLILLVLFATLGALLSPLAFPHSVSAAEAVRRSADDGRPIIYWRPGCPFCMRLRTRLGRYGARAHWVDIWSDPEGAAAVRAVTGGDETVPTVVAGADSWVNPAPSRVRELLRAKR